MKDLKNVREIKKLGITLVSNGERHFIVGKENREITRQEALRLFWLDRKSIEEP